MFIDYFWTNQKKLDSPFFADVFSNAYSIGWIIRLYYDLDQDDPILPQLCALSCQTNFDLCHIQSLPGTPMHNATFIFPMNWRFFPTLDPQVDMYLSRDLDSEFNERELSGKLSIFVQSQSN